MKTLLACLLTVLSWNFICCQKQKLRALSDAEIEYINSVQTSWRAGRNFLESELPYVKNLLGSIVKLPANYTNMSRRSRNIRANMPPSFDCRQQWPNCPTMNDIRDQGNCGSCWAFGAAEAMSDRICVATNKVVRISAEDILACCGKSCGKGCQGGDPYAAWQYFANQGVVTGGQYGSKQGCMPYTLPHCSHHDSGKYPNCTDPEEPTPNCTAKCIDTYNSTYKEDKHFGETPSQVYGVDQMMDQLYVGGPVTVTFIVYSDFLSYKSGVYKHTTGTALGGHAVKILGWGVENGEKYWLAANSWNEDWGDKGYFKIAHGQCGIESDITYAGIKH